MTTDESVRLRPVQSGDLPRMYDLQLDPESNRMAVTIPRTRGAFDSHWAKALADPGLTAWVILVGEELVGTISCFPMDGQDHVVFTLSSLSNIETSCLILFAAEGLFKRFCHERFQLAVEHGSGGRNPAVAKLPE